MNRSLGIVGLCIHNENNILTLVHLKEPYFVLFKNIESTWFLSTGRGDEVKWKVKNIIENDCIVKKYNWGNNTNTYFKYERFGKMPFNVINIFKEQKILIRLWDETQRKQLSRSVFFEDIRTPMAHILIKTESNFNFNALLEMHNFQLHESGVLNLIKILQ